MREWIEAASHDGLTHDPVEAVAAELHYVWTSVGHDDPGLGWEGKWEIAATVLDLYGDPALVEAYAKMPAEQRRTAARLAFLGEGR
jgi:hypothetical protein